MVNWNSKMDIISLYKEHGSIRKVSELTGHSRNTVRAILRNKPCPHNNKRKRKSLLEPYYDYVKDSYERGLNARVIYRELQKMDFSGSYYVVQRYCQTLKASRVSHCATVRFETAPGKQAQMDWGYLWHAVDSSGKKKQLYVFVCILSYSRTVYVEVTPDMKLPTLIDCHKRAFDYFGGIPDEIIYDNMKQVRLTPEKLNPCFEDFAAYYGYAVKTCRPYRARTKGKVERAVKYFKRNFLPGRSFCSFADANAQSREWMENTANCRVHATTKQKPFDLLVKEELNNHYSLPAYKLVKITERKVSAEGYVRYNGNLYSVPPENVDKKVTVEHVNSTIRVLAKDLIIAEHDYSSDKGKTFAKKEHVEQMWKLTVSARSKSKSESPLYFFAEEDFSRSLSTYEDIAQ